MNFLPQLKPINISFGIIDPVLFCTDDASNVMWGGGSILLFNHFFDLVLFYVFYSFQFRVQNFHAFSDMKHFKEFFVLVIAFNVRRIVMFVAFVDVVFPFVPTQLFHAACADKYASFFVCMVSVLICSEYCSIFSWKIKSHSDEKVIRMFGWMVVLCMVGGYVFHILFSYGWALLCIEFSGRNSIGSIGAQPFYGVCSTHTIYSEIVLGMSFYCEKYVKKQVLIGFLWVICVGIVVYWILFSVCIGLFEWRWDLLIFSGNLCIELDVSLTRW